MKNFPEAGVVLAVAAMLWGCSGESQQPPVPEESPPGTSVRGDATGLPSTPSAQNRDQRPTQLENCVTAVGADRSGCVAKER